MDRREQGSHAWGVFYHTKYIAYENKKDETIWILATEKSEIFQMRT